jgi:hypothetical protein
MYERGINGEIVLVIKRINPPAIRARDEVSPSEPLMLPKNKSPTISKVDQSRFARLNLRCVRGVAVVIVSISPAETFHDEGVHVTKDDVQKRSRNDLAARTGLNISFPNFLNGIFTIRIAKIEPRIAVKDGVFGGKHRARSRPVKIAEQLPIVRRVRVAILTPTSQRIEVITHKEITRTASSPKK